MADIMCTWASSVVYIGGLESEPVAKILEGQKKLEACLNDFSVLGIIQGRGLRILFWKHRK